MGIFSFLSDRFQISVPSLIRSESGTVRTYLGHLQKFKNMAAFAKLSALMGDSFMAEYCGEPEDAQAVPGGETVAEVIAGMNAATAANPEGETAECASVAGEWATVRSKKLNKKERNAQKKAQQARLAEFMLAQIDEAGQATNSTKVIECKNEQNDADSEISSAVLVKLSVAGSEWEVLSLDGSEQDGLDRNLEDSLNSDESDSETAASTSLGAPWEYALVAAEDFDRAVFPAYNEKRRQLKARFHDQDRAYRERKSIDNICNMSCYNSERAKMVDQPSPELVFLGKCRADRITSCARKKAARRGSKGARATWGKTLGAHGGQDLPRQWKRHALLKWGEEDRSAGSLHW